MPKYLWYSKSDFAFSAMSVVGKTVTIGGMQVSLEYCQLMLTPISEMSDEHAIEVAKIFDPELLPEEMARVGRFFANRKDYCFGDMDYNRTQQIIDYLRSVGYDCGYGSIPSLIEAGIAIKAEKK